MTRLKKRNKNTLIFCKKENKKMDDEVIFKCVSENRRLRVRIISNGYNSEANCQFPRAIRREGAYYKAPRTAVNFSRGPRGKFFYRVTASLVRQLSEAPTEEEKEIKINNIYDSGEEDCCICMVEVKSVVFSPCGHYTSCYECATKLQSKCPICRGNIEVIVKREDIQI